MSKFAAWLRSVFQGQLSFFTSMFERNTALRLAWVAFAITLIATLYATVNGILAGLAVAMPSWATVPASWVVPSNLDECITAYFGAHVAVYVFEWKLRISSKYAY
jgi:ABC-type spermidine/putrescine transport system permease subunit II